MLANMKAQLRACDKDRKSGEFVARWPMCSTYLFNNRHEDEIESKGFVEPRVLTNCAVMMKFKAQSLTDVLTT